MGKKGIIVLLVLVFVAALQPDVAAQCSMCKQAVSSSMKTDESSLGRSLNSGILYLMAVPYLALMFIFRKQLAKVFRHYFRRSEVQS